MLPPSPLAEIFREHAPGGLIAPEESSALERLLVETFETARSPWPNLELPAERFVCHVAERLSVNGERKPVEQALRSLHLSDLYLACACAAGTAGAIAILERDYLAKVPGVLRRQRRSPETIEEIVQKLNATLLGQSHISTYTGEGKLWSWIEVIAKRMANREDRSRTLSPPGAPEVADVLDIAGNVEKDVIKKDLLAALQAAIREAGSALTEEQRELLRFHYRNGVSESKLAKFFGTSQPTISRRLSRAKELIFTEARRVMLGRLRITEDDFESFIAEVRSRWLDLSLSQLFGSSDGHGPPGQ